MLKKYTRTYRLFSRMLVVEDRIDAAEPVTVDYLLHTLSKPESDGSTAVVERNGSRLRITPMLGGLTDCTIADEYDTPLNEGVPAEYQVQMPEQFHLRWHTEAKKHHCIAVRYDLL